MDGIKTTSKQIISSRTGSTVGEIKIYFKGIMVFTYYKKIVARINYLRYMYYNCSISVVDDYQFDIWYRELENLEEEFPFLKSKESPTEHIECPIKLCLYFDWTTNYGKKPYPYFNNIYEITNSMDCL